MIKYGQEHKPDRKEHYGRRNIEKAWWTNKNRHTTIIGLAAPLGSKKSSRHYGSRKQRIHQEEEREGSVESQKRKLVL